MAYTKKQKEKIMAQYEKARESGKTAREAAKGTGASYLTILRWRKAMGKFEPPNGSKAAKGAAPRLTDSRLSVLTPDGYRIETDFPAEVVAVLNALR